MSVSLYGQKVAKKLLFLQLFIVVFLSALFRLKSADWAMSALAGGLAAWVSNAMFMLVAWRNQAQVSGRVAWFFVISEVLKVLITIVLLVAALSILKAAFVPLGLTYLAALVTQILAPVVIHSYCT